jgi:hypothetical protein
MDASDTATNVSSTAESDSATRFSCFVCQTIMSQEESQLQSLLADFEDTPSASPASGNGGDEVRCGGLTNHDMSEPQLLDVTPLHNRKRGSVVLQQEQLHHRIFALLKAQGYDCREIAEMTGYTPTTVQYTLAQPWMEKMILDEVMKIGRTKIAAVLDAEVLPSVQKLIALRDSTQSTPEVQRKCSNDLLNRVFGMPNQPISRSDSSAIADARKMSDAEIAEEISRLRSRGAN